MEVKIKNKKLLLLVLVFLITLLFINSVCAEIIINEEEISLEFDYSELNDDDDKLDISKKITIKNNGSGSENVVLSLLKFGSKYDLELNKESLELNSGASSEVIISGKVPVNLDQGTHKEIGILKVGDLEHEISADVLSMLTLKKIYFLVNGHNIKTIDEDNEKVKNLEPNDEIELQFRLKNIFDDDYDDGDIDGTVYVTLDDNDFGDDIDEEEDFAVDAGAELNSDDEMVYIKFTIPDNVEEGTYNLEIKVESEDENEATYETKLDIELEIEREKDDVRVENITLTPNKISCHRSFQVVTKVTNYGTDLQKHVLLELISFDLVDHIQEIPEFSLSRGTKDDSSVLKQQYIELPLSLPAGKYQMEAIAYYDYNKFADRKVVQLEVEDCASLQSDNAEQENNENVSNNETGINNSGVQNDIGEGNLITSSKVVNTVEEPYTQEDVLFWITLLGVILVTFMMITFFIILMK